MTAITKIKNIAQWGFGGPYRQYPTAKIIRQTGKAFCFEAVFQMLCAHYRLNLPKGTEIRKYSGTTRRGTSIKGACKSLEALGFAAQAGQCDYSFLQENTAPSIAIVNQHDGSLHYVLINRATNNGIEILDPACGSRKFLGREEFERKWTRTLILASPKPRTVKNLILEKDPYSLAMAFIREESRAIVIAAIASILQIVFLLTGFLVLRQLLRSVTNHASAIQIIGLVAGFLVFALLKSLSNHLFEKLKQNIRQRLNFELEFSCSDRIRNLEDELLKQTDAQDLTQRCRNESSRIARHFVGLVDSGGQSAGVFLLLITIGWLDQFSVVFFLAACTLPLAGLVTFLQIRKQNRLERSSHEANDLAQKMMIETIAGIKPLRRMDEESARIRDVQIAQIQASDEKTKLETHRHSVQSKGLAFGGVLATSVLIAGICSSSNPNLIISQFIVFNLLGFSCRKMMVGLCGLPEMMFSIRRFQEFFFEEVDDPKRRAGSLTEGLKHQLRRLKFFDIKLPGTYENGQSKFSLEISRGETVLLVDESRKTIEDLVQILTGQADLESGCITLDGTDIRDVRSRELHGMIGFVPTDPYIFQADLRFNIQLSDVPNENLQDAVQRAGLDKLVSAMPQKLDTVIGKRGMFTHAEERYRIGLARLELMKTDAIVLELPNYRISSLLLETINGLIAACWKDRIVIMVSAFEHSGLCYSRKIEFENLGIEMRKGEM